MTAALVVVYTALTVTFTAALLLVWLASVRSQLSYEAYSRLVGVSVFLGLVGLVSVFVGLAFHLGGTA